MDALEAGVPSHHGSVAMAVRRRHHGLPRDAWMHGFGVRVGLWSSSSVTLQGKMETTPERSEMA